MTLLDSATLANDSGFKNRVAAAAVNAALAAYNEVANDVQTISVTGSPTGGSFVLAGIVTQPVTLTGTTTSAANTVTGLSSTAGLFVGMSVSGTGIAANSTVASITSATAITLSVNATASGSASLTFSGNQNCNVPFNCTAGQLQTILGNVLGAGNMVVTGGPLPGTALVVTFVGALANLPHVVMTIGTNSLTGGSSPTPSVAHTTTGVAVANHAARQARASKVLQDPWAAGVQMAPGVAANAAVVADFTINNATGAVSLAVGKTEADVTNDIQFQVNSVFSAYT